MQKKKVYYFLLLCCPLFYFCSDHPDVVDYESMQSKEPELLGAAKALLKTCGNTIHLSDLSGGKENGVSSRGLGHPSNSVPSWDEAVQLPEFNGEEILLIPLKEEKKRYAYAKIKKGNEISRQFSTSFSRLIVRKKGGRTIAHVFTYLPERKYVKANRTRLDSLKYHPEEVGYEGFVLISSLNGTFKHGFLYEDGKATVRLTYGHQHTDDCTSCSHTEGSDADVRFNISFCTETLKSRGYSRGVEDDSEAYICSFCGQPVDDCVCLTIEGEYIYCDGCGMLQGQCVCDLLVCPTCNDYPCTCFDYSDYCSICGSDPCTCGSGEDECPVCHSNPCTCDDEDGDTETEAADPCTTKQLLNENDVLNNKVSDLLDLIHNGYIATEEGWIKTNNNTYYSPSKKTATSLSYDWSGITEKNITEWYHSHPSGSPYPSFADLEVLCKKANDGYVVDYDNFTYGIISCTGCISFIITSPSIFKTFCTNMSSSAKSNIETAYTNLIMNTNQTMSMEDRLFYLLFFLNVQNTGLSILYREYGLDWEQWEGIEMGTDTVQNIECN